MSKYLIIVEGIADIIFLKDYLGIYNTKCTIHQNNIKKEKLLKINLPNKEIKIIVGGGCTALLKIKKTIQEHSDDGYKILVVQDADDCTKRYGGLIKRLKYLDTVQKKLEVDFEIFLFPNHNDDGDLETLLLQIANTQKFTASESCYSQYIQCVSKISQKEFCDELLDRKAQVFNYFRTYYGMECAKEENRDYSKIYWNFNHQALSAFQTFFNRHLT